MRIKIKRFDKNLPLPKYHSDGAAAFDLTARETIEIPAGEIGYVPLNVAIDTPKEYFLLVAARSSTHKKGLILANGIGIGDPDFCGDNDEYTAIYYNFTDKPITVERGERIAQGMFVKFERAKWEEIDKLGHKTRGGIGSTGEK